MAKHFLHKRYLKCILTGIPIGGKLSIDLLINFPEFQSNDSQQAWLNSLTQFIPNEKLFNRFFLKLHNGITVCKSHPMPTAYNLHFNHIPHVTDPPGPFWPGDCILHWNGVGKSPFHSSVLWEDDIRWWPMATLAHSCTLWLLPKHGTGLSLAWLSVWPRLRAVDKLLQSF